MFKKPFGDWCMVIGYYLELGIKFEAFGFWTFEFVSDFDIRISNLFIRH